MRTSVEIALQDSASAQAQKIATGFDAISQSADGINSALDPKMLEDYNRQLTQIGENYSQLKNKEKNYNQQQVNMARQVQGLATSAGTGIAQLGAGNIGGAAASAGGGISSLASLLGGPATMIAGLGLAGGMATNALANQYEQRAAPAGRVSALSGQYGTDVRSNTLALRDAMESTTDAVAKYGKTFEEGARAQETFLMAGGTNFGGSRAAAYSQAYGADFNQLAGFEGLTGRYGQTGGVQSADWVRKRQGLSPAMLGEVIGGMQDVFTQGLSRGVVRSTSDIARSMDYFSGAGASFQGALGAQKLAGMGQTLAGAGALQSQSDMFLYRAASKLSGGDYLETRKMMEGGMNPEMFKGIMGEFEQFGYGKTESIMQLSKIFGMSITEAEKVYNNQGRGTGRGTGTALAEGLGATTETQYTGDVENIKQGVSRLGAKAFDIRAKAVGGGADMMSMFSDAFGGGMATEGITANKIKASQLEVERIIERIPYSESVSQPLSLAGHSKYGVQGKLMEALKSGVSESEIALAIGDKLTGYTSRSSAGGYNLTEGETSDVVKLLSELIEATKETTSAVREDVILEDNTDLGRGMTQ